MKLRTMPKETAAELLLYLAENERFDTLEHNTSGAVTAPEVRALLREIAGELNRAIATEVLDLREEAQENTHLKRKTREVLDCLSPLEEKYLLTVCGFANRE